jgi:zinc/manganese transport system substrate-binding protein
MTRVQISAIDSSSSNTFLASARTARTSFEWEKQIMKFILNALLLLACAITLPAQAALRVLATTPEWGALTTELGGDKVNVYVATTAFQDPHRIEAKPSLIARARSADLIVAVGAQLEIGWLPVLLQESGNAHVQPGTPGYFEADAQLKLLEIPTSVDRSLGDIHPLGNPHAHLDAHNIATVATALSTRLAQLDAANAQFYQSRYADFQARWQQAITRWETQAAPLKGIPIVVIHRDQVYLCHWLGLKELAAIEPKPGVPPSAGYLGELVTKLAASPPKMILRNAYNDPKAVTWLSDRVHAPVVTLPFTVGGTPAAKDLFSLFDDTINKLLGALQ